MAGVTVIRDGDLTAVLHPYPEVAQQALGRLKARFDLPRTGLNHENIFAHLLKHAPAPVANG